MIDAGPFQFHFSEKTSRRVLAMLPYDFTPADIMHALRLVESEDRIEGRAKAVAEGCTRS